MGVLPAVSVVVPWRAGDCPWRTRSWAYVRSWWARRHPDWQVLTGEPPPGGWRKAAAVGAALPRAAGRVLVVADADVICAGVAEAVERVASGEAPWAVPHRDVYRLSPAMTALIHNGQAGLPALEAGPLGWRISEAHRGVPGGGLVVLPRQLYREIPLDARFAGWGQEDAAWGHALTVAAGQPWRGGEPLWHLHHPPQRRASRAVGSREGLALYRRYRGAYLPGEVLALLAEPGARAR